MKKIVLLLTIVISTAIFYFTPAQAEVIRSFNADIIVEKNGTTAITETIVYDSEGIERRGIFRTIRLRSADGEKVSLNNLSVTDLSGVRYDYTVQRSNDGITIKIGNETSPFVGEKTYVIEYKIDGAVTHLIEALDEFYWNITGDTWPFRIETVQARITLPEGVIHTATACYQGIRGSQESCRIENEGSIFSSTRILTPGEGFTVAVGFPAGIVIETPPTLLEKIKSFVIRYWSLLVPVFVFFIMYRRWSKKGKDPKESTIVIPEYDVPENVTPLEAEAIITEGVKTSGISAQLVYLAVHGYLKIVQIKQKTFGVFSQVDYELHLLKDFSSADPVTTKILHAIFGISAPMGKVKKISELKDTFYASIENIDEVLTKNLIAKEYYTNLSNTFRSLKNNGWSLFAVLGMIVLVVVSVFGFSDIIIPTVAAIISIFIYIFFQSLMPRKSEKGIVIKRHLLGLKMYLEIAEKDRLAFHNAPEKKPELFEKLLPYAMVFGVERLWAKEFQNIYTTTPSWYSGAGIDTVTAMTLVDSISVFENHTLSSFAAPSNTGGGSGGGGFSGGGGGGGGGGSW